MQQLAGDTAVPHSVAGCCEVDNRISGLLFSRKAVLDVLFQQGDLVYGRTPVSKARLLLWEQWVDDWINTSVDESLEDFKGVTQQIYWTVTLGPPVAFLVERSQLLALFSRSLEFGVDACRK